ncbi:Bug family tripartite tricarboxylate transporter substrate binding protein [Falsiroseomonas sp. CW058]|uniref:Bug family tripartite tricarboxylate transporter substrate binding protein n=1 Tax=Falsiroseomonas sp. CW058 TaxID=3388664 RepID=UPI003D319767
MTTTRRTLLGAALAAPLAAPALAQGVAPSPWPTRPIRLVIPFAAGGTTDIIGRLMADEMSRSLGQPIVVENRGGAGATLGTGLVAQAAPDGYTLLLSTISGMAIGNTLYRDRIQWDADRDFAHIAMLLGTPYLLVVNPRFPAQSVADYVAEARRRPQGLEFATSGVGSVPHLLGLRLAQATGISLTHIPYRGGAQAATDVMAGVVPSMIDSLTAASANMRANVVRALAFSSPERIADFPSVPTFAELGMPQLNADGWAGLAAPARTPRPVLEKLAEAVRAAQAAPNVQRRFAETATQPGRVFLDDAQAFVRAEVAAWAPVVRASGATPE